LVKLIVGLGIPIAIISFLASVIGNRGKGVSSWGTSGWNTGGWSGTQGWQQGLQQGGIQQGLGVQGGLGVQQGLGLGGKGFIGGQGVGLGGKGWIGGNCATGACAPCTTGAYCF
jgi:hypothetical protein